MAWGFKPLPDMLVANRVATEIKDMVDKVFSRDFFGEIRCLL
jgi:hypothetical protein